MSIRAARRVAADGSLSASSASTMRKAVSTLWPNETGAGTTLPSGQKAM